MTKLGLLLCRGQKDMEVFFCLNCDDWIKDNAALFNEGWKMFDDKDFCDMTCKGEMDKTYRW